MHTQILWRQKQPLPVDGLVIGLDVAHRAPFLPWHHLGCSILGHGGQRCDAGWCLAWLDTLGVVPRENECVRDERSGSWGRRGRDTDAAKKKSPGGVFEAQAREVVAQGGRHCTASNHARKGACGISIRWAKHGEAPGKSLFPPARCWPGPDVSRQALQRQCGCLNDDRLFQHGIPSEGPHFDFLALRIRLHPLRIRSSTELGLAIWALFRPGAWQGRVPFQGRTHCWLWAVCRWHQQQELPTSLPMRLTDKHTLIYQMQKPTVHSNVAPSDGNFTLCW